GTLTIKAEEKNDGIEIQIQDSGDGIPEEVQAKMFNAFYTTKPIGKGSGLGLYICKKIVDKHHGQISVQSQPGETRFNVWLPLAI
ncbi:MAG: HAMP domain-containing histidine kinase, partial [Acaryochloridaceae cyanobacterium RL_2_7]|nr:HAMP domain-containing histidine kinase [Acaryochloridaceae cyanobacterium RL_2_7]